MGLTRFMLKLYKWDALSDQSLLEMRVKVGNGILRASELSMGSGFMARSSQKDLDKLFEAKEKIEAEMSRRGLS